MSHWQNVPVAVHEKVERLDERIGLSSASAGFNEEAFFAVEAAVNLSEGSLTGLLS